MAILSQTSEYALRAATLLAQHAEPGPLDVAVLAEALGIPRNYLSKTLSQLVRAGVLESVRGKHGGFRLAQLAANLTLYDVVEPFEHFAETRRCLLGQSVCNDRQPCAAHEGWKAIGERIVRFFRRTTLADLARSRTRWPNAAVLTRALDSRVAD